MTSPRIVLLLAALGACTADAAEVASSEQAVAVTWQNAVGVSAVGNDLTKTAAQSTWAAGASSIETISGDGFTQFTTGEATTAKMVGLNVNDVNRGFTELDFAIYLTATGKVHVYESGVNRGQFGTYVAGDVLRIDATTGGVTYSRNGAGFYTSSLFPSFPLRVDTSLYTPGATIQEVELVSFAVSWKSAVGVAAAANSLTKTAAQDTWAAGASSIETLTGDGAVELSTSETTTAKMAGLSVGDANRGFAEIDYAIYLTQLGKVLVYENGVNRGQVGTYAAGDVFRIEIAGTAVAYRKNGALLYTSTVAPSFPLGVDTSLKTPGATITAVKLTPGPQVCPAYAGAGPVCAGSYTINNAADIAAIASCARITGFLEIPDSGLTEVSLPNLQRVDNGLFIENFFTAMTIRLPALREVGGNLQVPPLATAELPRLRSAGMLDADVGDISVPCLDSVGTIKAGNLDAPRLRTAGAIFASATLPMLEHVFNAVSGDLTAPMLTVVGGSVAGAIDAPALIDVGALSYGAQTQVPALQRAGALYLVDVDAGTSVDLPVLVEVTGPIRAIADGAVPILTLPALETAGSLELLWLNEVQLPALQELTGSSGIGFHSSGGPFELPALTAITGSVDAGGTLDAPALATITGAVTTIAPQAWPALTQIDGDLELITSLSAPELVGVTGVLQLTDATTASLPGLTEVGGINAVADNLSTLDLPSLATVTTTATSPGAGAVQVRFTNLTTLVLPALATIPGVLYIRSNTITRLELPALTSIGPSLTIQQNLQLPNCYALRVRDQLFAAGWSGTVTISGNTGAGGCP